MAAMTRETEPSDSLHDELVEFGHTLPDEPPIEVRRVLTSDGLILVVGPLPSDDAGERAAREFVKSITVMDDLGAAWAAAEAALPFNTTAPFTVFPPVALRDGSLTPYIAEIRLPRENAGPRGPQHRVHRGEGDSPAAALRALAAALAPTEPVG